MVGGGEMRGIHGSPLRTGGVHTLRVHGFNPPDDPLGGVQKLEHERGAHLHYRRH